ncbi:MAG: hypothetical protein IJU37_06545 [Desulfovibrio sp.]|nr:hypothetical protein [Desulfovibrio sp.]
MSNEMYSLPDEQRRMLLNIAVAAGCSTDELETAKFTTTSPEYARGYLEGVLDNASDDRILLMYFLLSMVTARKT